MRGLQLSVNARYCRLATASIDKSISFAAVDLGLIDRTSKKLRRFAAARPCRPRNPKTGKTVNHVSGP